jgi:2-methylisocitrate lyase-like PEP mutase family enzyme
MPKIERSKCSWSDLLKKEGLLQLPVAHDALTAKLIELAGFPAYQIGGFALEGSLYGYPDADLTHLGEKSVAVERIIATTKLPVLVDCDDGYGDAKNVTRTVERYEAMGVDAIFIEDQRPPKECGHMSGKVVVPPDAMAHKIEAAVAARRDAKALFILARTDARQPEGVDAAIERARQYLKAGADGAYVEGPESEEELKTIGKAFKGTPLATSILERGGVTPWVSPKELHAMGFTMILYPATVLFRATESIRRALKDLRNAKELNSDESVDMKQFEEIVDAGRWKRIQKKFHGGPEWDEGE